MKNIGYSQKYGKNRLYTKLEYKSVYNIKKS